MKVIVDIPKKLFDEAMEITNSESNSQLAKLALEDIIRKNKIQKIKSFKGKIDIN